MNYIAAFYQFASLEDYADLQQPLLTLGRQHNLLGTILLAEEGVNGTIAGPEEGIAAVLATLRQHPHLRQLEHKGAWAAENPFYRWKVKLKKEIVSFGVPAADPSELAGIYVPPQQWNELISQPDVVLIDTRNDYEVQLGTFAGAINPATTTFREFPAYVQSHLHPQENKRVAMFCTGGIRCEKATAYLRLLGFEEVYHLQGGILKYLEEVAPEESLWEGECFVFDQRVAVDHHLRPGEYHLCYACQRPLTAADLESPAYEEGISCPHCIASLTPRRRASLAERHKQMQLAQQRAERHLGEPQTRRS
jgi:UPF0176 protein